MDPNIGGREQKSVLIQEWLSKMTRMWQREVYFLYIFHQIRILALKRKGVLWLEMILANANLLIFFQVRKKQNTVFMVQS